MLLEITPVKQVTDFVPYAPSIVRDFTDRSHVPNKPGVYVVTSGRRILYVGKATVSIRERHTGKFDRNASPSDRGLVALAKQSNNCKIHCIPIPFGRRWIGSVEGRLIQKLKPEYNKRGERIFPIVSALEFPLIALATLWNIASAFGIAAIVGLMLWRAFVVLFA